jgi:hypothetical protein
MSFGLEKTRYQEIDTSDIETIGWLIGQAISCVRQNLLNSMIETVVSSATNPRINSEQLIQN